MACSCRSGTIRPQGGFSNFLSNAMLDHFISNGPYYLSVNTSDPGLIADTATTSEVASARVQVSWETSAARRLYNDTEFAVTATANASHWSLWDAATDGALIASGELRDDFIGVIHFRPFDLGLALDPYDHRLGENHPNEYVSPPANTPLAAALAGSGSVTTTLTWRGFLDIALVGTGSVTIVVGDAGLPLANGPVTPGARTLGV